MRAQFVVRLVVRFNLQHMHMFSSVMFLMLAAVEHVLSDELPTYCLITKRIKDQANFTVQSERCADGVHHCLITLSVTNDTTSYVRQNFHCWPWPELQSSCPSQSGVCQLLHISDDQLHRTCCCRGSMCNNATLTYVPLRNESVVSTELRTRLQTFGLRDAAGQLLLDHDLSSAMRSTLHDWFESHSTRLVIACLAVLVACLSIGLVALVHYCPTSTNASGSSQSSSAPHSFLRVRRPRYPLLGPPQAHPLHRRHKLRPVAAPTALQKPSNSSTCCSIPCVWPFSLTGRARDRTLSVSLNGLNALLTSPGPRAHEKSHIGHHPLVSLNARHDDDETASADLLRFGSAVPDQFRSVYKPGNRTEQSTAELELMLGVANSCELLRCLGHGRFAEVWLANAPVSSVTSTQATDNLTSHHAQSNLIDADMLRRSNTVSDVVMQTSQLDIQSHPLRTVAHRSSSPSNQTLRHGDDDVVLVAVKIFSASEQRAWATEFAVFRAVRASANPIADNQSLGSRYNLVRMFGAGKTPTDYRIVMEFAPNGSLRQFLDRGQWLSFRAAVGLGRDMARGLSYLHSDCPRENKPCMAHRDLKPENVLIRTDGSACLSDFGQAVFLSSTGNTTEDSTSNSATASVMSATNTVTGLAASNLDAVPKAGTLRYMAPEILDGAIQFNNRSILCTDIYSFSLCLWELLSAVSDVLLDQVPSDRYPEPKLDRDPLTCAVNPHPLGAVGQPRHVWLPYERELGRDCASPQAMRNWVSVLKHRPTVNATWCTTTNEQQPDAVSQLIAQFYRTISDCWDSEPEARLSATCVLERLNAIHAQLSHVKNVVSKATA